jgi:hypothetical protein
MSALLRFFLAASVLVSAIVSASPARAEATTPPPRDDEGRPGKPRDHIEFTMGFLGGQRAYDGLGFTFDGTSPASQLGGAEKLTKPFGTQPFTNVNMLGVRYEARVVIAYARMTAGFDLPFSSYRASTATGMYDVGGTSRQITVDSLSAKEGHFGLGLEVPFGPVAPFVDLLGGAHWVNTDLTIDGKRASYASTAFAFSMRGGARVYMRRWFFIQGCGEVGLVGDLKWNAELSVGAALL